MSLESASSLQGRFKLRRPAPAGQEAAPRAGPGPTRSRQLESEGPAAALRGGPGGEAAGGWRRLAALAVAGRPQGRFQWALARRLRLPRMPWQCARRGNFKWAAPGTPAAGPASSG